MLDYIVIQDRSTFRVCLLLFFPHGNKWSEGIKLTNADIFVPFAKVSKYRMKQPKTKIFSYLENWDPISHKKHFYQFYKKCGAVCRWIHPHITSMYVLSTAQSFAWSCFHVKKIVKSSFATFLKFDFTEKSLSSFCNSPTIFLKNFVKVTFFTIELYCKLISREFFQVGVNFRHYHTVDLLD